MTEKNVVVYCLAHVLRSGSHSLTATTNLQSTRDSSSFMGLTQIPQTRYSLGLLRCLSYVGLYERNMLRLPLQSIGLGFKQNKAQMVLELGESIDQLLRAAGSQYIYTNWEEVESPGRVRQGNQQTHTPQSSQQSPGGLSRPWRRVTPLFWSKASKEKRRAMVVAEVTRAEQEHHNNKAVSQSRQGSWISWEGVTGKAHVMV